MEKDSDGGEIPRDYKSLIPWNLKGMTEKGRKREEGERNGKEEKQLNEDRLSSRECESG